MATAAALLAVAGVVACESSSPSEPPEPVPSVRQIAIEQEIQVRIEAGSSALYEVSVGDDRDVIVQLTVVSGAGTLTILDSAGVATVATVRGEAREGATDWLTAGPISNRKMARYRIRATGPGELRFRVIAPPRTRAPEWVSAKIALNDTIAGEDFHEHPGTQLVGDVDDFIFDARAGDMIFVYFQALGGRTGHVEIFISPEDDITDVLLPFIPQGNIPHPELESQASRLLVIPSDGSYRIRLSSIRSGIAQLEGAYRFMVRRVERLPETLEQTLPVGETVTEELLDYIYDIDEFVLEGDSGDEFNILFRVTNGDPLTQMRLELPEVEGYEGRPFIRSVHSTGRDSLLTDRGTGRFALPASGRLLVRVMPNDLVGGPRSQGSYELIVHPIDRAPESSPPILALGDSVLGERLDLPEDVDEFFVTIPTATRVNVVLEVDSTTHWFTQGISSAVAQLVRSDDGSLWAGTGTFSDPPWSKASGPVTLPAGDYVLRLYSNEARVGSYLGAYRAYLYVVNETPETAPASVAIGGSVTEALDPSGDVDVFTFVGERGDHLDVLLETPPASPAHNIGLSIIPPDDGLALALAGVGRSTPEARTGRFTLPETGQYQLRVAPGSGGEVPAEKGPYTFTLMRAASGPEHHSATISLGDSVLNELLDEPGDVDEFILRGAPGDEAVAFLTASEDTRGLWLEVENPSTRQLLASTPSFIATESVGRFTIPASGEVMLRVFERQWRPLDYSLVGPYTITTERIDRAPEQLPVSIALNDTIAGEAISPPGDVDEFTFAGTAGQRVELHLDTPMGVEDYAGLWAELLAPGAGTILGSVMSSSRGELLEDQSSGVLTLPSTGTYVVRIRGDNDRKAAGEYRFMVRLVQ